ncbi:WXG100 family type VII secretion target [Aeromicrobium fastidiosum]|uniref:PE-PPE domain-containing protein n=2 Tax=Aeromicrobium fastidiosum TaxID=52699 RepID=A0A641AL35_9ACTN|nr:hypothetical protein [Aeromicrobium fastidiosum]KAA1374676.1 hypothetical protein ESP62_014890 [Aeromicrobium fastidiosum]
MIGADVEALERLAGQFEQAASRLRHQAESVSSGVKLSAWVGPVAIRFRHDWDSTHSARLRQTAATLDDSARILRQNAAEQRRASGASTGSAQSPKGAGSSDSRLGPSSGLGDDFETYSDMKPDEHGVRLVKVTGDDGVERYVVYVGGTGSDGDALNPGRAHSAYDAISATGGIDTVTAEYVRRRMASIPEGAEVMMVGYSQGGVHAMDFAGTGKYNITDVVTFGAPINASPNARLHGVNVLSVEQAGDRVPNLGAARTLDVFNPVMAYDNVRLLFSSDTAGQSATYRGDAGVGGLSGGHGNPDTYRILGERFDQSSEGQVFKESQERYRQGKASVVAP